MSIIEKLQAESNNINAVKNEVISEITTAFSNYLDNDFENFLEKNIGNSAKQKREYNLNYEFWEHIPGCNPTRFCIAGWKWKNESVPDYSYDQNFYKGIRLKDIQEEVLTQLLFLLENYLKKEGFNYSENRFDYKSGVVSIYW